MTASRPNNRRKAQRRTTLPEPFLRRNSRRIRPIRIAFYIAGFAGLALATYLVAEFGAAAVLASTLSIGWGLAAVSAFHLLPLLLTNLSWRELLPRDSRPGAGTLLWIRWIRESINTLLPVGQVGGDLVCVRLVHLYGVPAVPAVASMVVDLTISLLSQMIFAMLGLALLVLRSTEPAVLAVVWAILAGMGILLAAVVVFLLLQHAGIFGLATRIGGRLIANSWAHRISAKAGEIDASTRALYRDRKSFWTAMAWRIAHWLAGAGEVWILMYFLGKPVTVAEALILESLAMGIRSAAFLVPGAIGILEGSFVVLGALLGIAPADALALALGKRVRELLIGLPGLVAWQIAEGRRFFGRIGKAPSPGPDR